jgi:hypothetical protein
MSKRAAGLAMLVSLSFSSAANADADTWVGATVCPTKSSTFKDSLNLTTAAFRVIAETRLPALKADGTPMMSEDGRYELIDYIAIPVGNGPLRWLPKDGFIQIDGAITYFKSRLVANPMDEFALRKLAQVEAYFGDEQWRFDWVQANSLRSDLEQTGTGRYRRKWTEWVNQRMIPPHVVAVSASDCLILPPQIADPPSPGASGSSILLEPAPSAPSTR